MYEKSVKILNVEFNGQAEDKLLLAAQKMMREKTPCTIFTPNPQMLLAAHKDGYLSALLRSASISLPDGIGITIASKMLYGKALPRISGIDFAQRLLSIASKRGYSVFLLGGKEGRAEAARDNLRKKMPSLNICGYADGYFQKSGEENERIRQKINTCSPDILFVCFGFPAQEKWIVENLSFLPSVCLFMGLGGSIDVWSGQIKRSPPAMRKIGLEWLWRSLREPRRLKIFWEIPAFLWLVTAQKRALRSKAKRS